MPLSVEAGHDDGNAWIHIICCSSGAQNVATHHVGKNRLALPVMENTARS
jgi:hypothetical protein